MLILQESCTDPTGSYVIYAPVDFVAMNVVLNGGDPNYVALLPSGFAILPDGPTAGIGEIGSGGSLLTVAFQILVDSIPTAKLSLGSVATVNSLIACTVERIKAAVSGENAQQAWRLLYKGEFMFSKLGNLKLVFFPTSEEVYFFWNLVLLLVLKIGAMGSNTEFITWEFWRFLKIKSLI